MSAKKSSLGSNNALRPQDVKSLLSLIFASGDNGPQAILVTGAPGVGKSDIIRSAAKDAACEIIITHPAISDPTDYKGLPFNKGDGTADFLPFGDLKRILNATVPTVVVMEDFGQATNSVQAACMQVLHSASGERRIGDHVIPNCVKFVLTSNRRTDRANVQGILETVKSRVDTIIELNTTVDDWTEWALDADIASEIIAFIRFRPELLHAFEASQDMTNSPCPRTWAHAAKLFALGVPKNLRLAVFSGSVGDGAAAEFIAFLEMYETAPSIDAILADPKNAPIPSGKNQSSIMYAVSAGLGAKANTKNIGSVAIYAKRVFDENLGEFTTLIMRDAVRRDKEIGKAKDFVKFCLSEAGSHIMEANTGNN